ncbi:MAG: FAD-binding oxidoreductase, partial [Firmicutes bacterium]|nr:FAD-binding oxidoreductase [Bacillota bacterium]
DLELPDAVVLPGSTAEVAAVVRLLYEHGVPVIPFGGGSGVLGGTTPVAAGVAVDLKRLDRVLAVDDASLTATAQAGILAVDLEATLGRHGLTLGHFPQSIDVATLGGLIATRSAGQFSTKYGNIEDLVLGLEVVLPEGRVIRTKVAARSSTGPDLKNLFVGSEGTLGVITEATLRVRPRPEKRVGRAYELERFHDGLEVVRRVLRTGLAPAVVRLYDPVEAQHSFREWVEQGRSLLVLVFEGLGRLVDLEVQVVEETLADFPHRALGPAPAEHWLERRNVVAALPEFMNQGLVVDTLEISTTWDRVGALYDAVLARMLAVRGVVAATAHSSHAYTHGTNLYLTFVALGPDLAEAERVYQEAWQAAMSACLEVGGTIGHHHGVGVQRRRWMAAEHGEALEVLRRLKAALDPKGLMNPGKLLPPSDTGARGDGGEGLR